MPEIISDRRIAGLKLLAVLSGMAGIAYEVLFFRLLTNYFGDMFYVHATLLSIFLLGIGIGSKRAYRFQRYLYIVQICIGLYAFALPSILALIQRMRWLALTIDNAAFTSFLTAALLIVPSLLIGFSIPLFSSYLKAISHENAFKSIYAVYNLGAFVSVLAIELILIRNLGITGSLYFNAGLNVIVGAIVFFGYNDISRKEPQKEQGGNVFAPGIIAALGLASFASAVFQMFFYKTCFHIFDTNRENFAIGLAIGLVAISIGTSLVRRFRLRFETCMLLTIFFLGLIFGNFKAIHSLFISIWDFGQYSCSYRLLSKMAFASIYGLAPMIFFGATIPAILVEEKSVARDSGYLLWVSCIGNALGYLSYVYYGHVHFSNVGLIGFIAGLCLLACLLMHGIGYLNKRKFVLSGLLLLIVLMFFSWNEKDFYLANPSVPDLYKNEKISEFSLYKNGPDSVVLAGSREDLALFYNGHPGIEVFFKDRVNLGELASGVFSALYTDDYSRALVLGLGSGITAGAT
ncbi:MAG: hypothetical protein JW869_03685, partial [Candidatus Omnitrophica bacterium]|nr:hypothetical protein [Candidatus Omnitrophota bacterium]